MAKIRAGPVPIFIGDKIEALEALFFNGCRVPKNVPNFFAERVSIYTRKKCSYFLTRVREKTLGTLGTWGQYYYIY